MNTTRTRTGMAAMAVAVMITCAGSAHAASGAWAVDASGNWSDAANWAGGVVADGAGELAYFDAIVITNDRTVTVDAPRTIGRLVFTQTNTWWTNFFVRGGALTLENTDGIAVIVTTNGRPRIYCPLGGTNALRLINTGQVGSSPSVIYIYSTNHNLGPIFLNARVTPGNTWALGTNTIYIYGPSANLDTTVTLSNRIVIMSNYVNDGYKELRGPVEFRTNHTLTAWGSINFNCPISGDGGMTKGGNEWGQITYSGTQPNTYTGLTILDTRGLTLQKSSNVVAIAGDVIIGRPGTTPANTTLTLNGHDQISDSATITLGESKVSSGINRGPIFIVGGYQDTIGALRTTNLEARVSLNGGRLTVGANNTDASFAGKIVGRGFFTKVGTGTMTFTNRSENTLTGVVSVAQGAVEVNGSFWATSTVVAAGATLKGSGIVSSDVVIASSGLLAPGSSTGVLTVAGSVWFADQGEYEWETGAAGSDLLRVEGDLSGANEVVINVINADAGTPDPAKTNALFVVTGTYTKPAGGYSFNLPTGWSVILNGSGDLINLGGGAYGAAFVPEPGLLAGLVLGLLALRRTR